METIDQLNAAWAGNLEGLNAQLWANMQAQGVTAGWVDPTPGAARFFSESLNGQERKLDQDELFEFHVRWRGETIANWTKHLAGADSVVISALMSAANKMEAAGVHVMPF